MALTRLRSLRSTVKDTDKSLNYSGEDQSLDDDRQLPSISLLDASYERPGIMCTRKTLDKNNTRAETPTGKHKSNLKKSQTHSCIDEFLHIFCFCWVVSHYPFTQAIIFLPCGFFLSFFFFCLFFPRLISPDADWMSTILPHIVWP